MKLPHLSPVDSEFSALPDAHKLDVLLALYEGLAHQIEISRRDETNAGMAFHARLVQCEGSLVTNTALLTLICQHLGIPLPLSSGPKVLDDGPKV